MVYIVCSICEWEIRDGFCKPGCLCADGKMVTCKQHPKYKVIHRPRVLETRPSCNCWRMWHAKHGEVL